MHATPTTIAGYLTEIDAIVAKLHSTASHVAAAESAKVLAALATFVQAAGNAQQTIDSSMSADRPATGDRPSSSMSADGHPTH